MKTLCVVQARMGSTRLPGKVMMSLRGRTVLERVLERASASRLVDETVVATGFRRENAPIVRLCSKLGVRVFSGSEEDVLDRYYQVAKLVAPRDVVRVTADCPLLDPAVVDSVVAEHRRSKADYTATTLNPTFPDGQDVEAFTFATLEKAWRSARLPSEREHVTAYIWKRPGTFTLRSVERTPDLSSKRWTLDTPADLRFLRAVYARLPSPRTSGVDSVMRVLRRYPALEAVNGGIERNLGYQKSLKEDRRFRRDNR